MKDVTPKKFGHELVKSRLPLSSRKSGQNHVDKLQYSRTNDWHVEIAVPRRHNIFTSETQNAQPDGSSVTKTIERRFDVTSSQDVEYEYVHIDDKQECSSVSNIFPDNFHAKEVTASHEALDEMSMDTSTITNEQCAGVVTMEEQRYLSKMQDRRSLDSTGTEPISSTMHGCCPNIANELASIQKQLLEIQNTQANFADILKVIHMLQVCMVWIVII